jgi:hypothetical protein
MLPLFLHSLEIASLEFVLEILLLTILLKYVSYCRHVCVLVIIQDPLRQLPSLGRDVR